METYNVTAHDTRSRLPGVGPDHDLWENHGLLVRGETPDGTDVTMWTSPYVIKRGAEETYYARDAAVLQTLLIAGRFSAEDKLEMHDNDFIAAGWLPADLMPLDRIAVENGESIVWHVEGRTFEDAPPVWKVSGEHAGVTIDATLNAEVPAFVIYPLELLDAGGGAGWYVAQTRAKASITYGETSLEVSGFGCHERAIVTRDHFPERLAGRGLYWHHLFGDEIQAWVMTSPTDGQAMAYVVVDGMAYPAEGETQVRLEDDGDWYDPRSSCTVPYRWKARVECDAGVLEYEASAFARAYYPWIGFKDAVNMLYWMSAEAKGTLTRPNGDVVSFEGAKYLGHNNRLFFSRSQISGH